MSHLRAGGGLLLVESLDRGSPYPRIPDLYGSKCADVLKQRREKYQAIRL